MFSITITKCRWQAAYKEKMFIQSVVLGTESPRSSGSVVGSASKPIARWLCGRNQRAPSTKLEARGGQGLSSPFLVISRPEDLGLVTWFPASGSSYWFLTHHLVAVEGRPSLLDPSLTRACASVWPPTSVDRSPTTIPYPQDTSLQVFFVSVQLFGCVKSSCSFYCLLIFCCLLSLD